MRRNGTIRRAAIKCPDCGEYGSHVKAGFNNSGSQRYQCKCGRITTRKRRADSSQYELSRFAAALLWHGGYSYREAARLLHVSAHTVGVWLSQSGYKEGIRIEIDESVFDADALNHLESRRSRRFEDEFSD